MSKREVEFKGRIEQGAAVEYLRELLSGLESGRLYVQSGDQFVELETADFVDLEIEAARKKDKSKLKLELSWSKEEVVETESSLKISTERPEVPEEEDETETAEPETEVTDQA